jgi:hypothetical protein
LDDARKLLGIYLNDHLGGAALGLQLAKRARNSNRGTELGAFLERLVVEVEEDRRSLEELMVALGVRRSPIKPALGVVAERLGRLKLNGRVTSYSPLSRLLELEGLTIGVHGKLSLWVNLREATAVGERVPGVDLDRLIERAERQLSEIEAHRLDAARRAIS